jgi:pimeloyl-ACP methyl ester carboxylesterase
LGGSIESWQWCDRHLGEGFRRILVDLPGAGKSPVSGASMSLDDFAAALVRVLERVGISETYLAGVALGAVVSAYMAANHPGHVAGVMMIAVGPAISETVARYASDRADLVEREGMQAVVDYSLKNSFPAGFAERHPDVFATYRQIFVANDPHHYAVASRAIARAGTTVTERLRRVQCPAAVVGGEFDPAFTPAVVAEVGRTLPRPVEPVIIAGAGHFPHIQAPAETARLLTRFFLGSADV